MKGKIVEIYASEDLPFESGKGYIIDLGVDFRLPDGYYVRFRDVPDYVIGHDVCIHPSWTVMFPSSSSWKIVMKNNGNDNMVIKQGDLLVYAVVMKGEMSDVEVIS